MIILGLGGLLNEPACVILRDGKLVAATEEKKLARPYVPEELPSTAIAAALELAGITGAHVNIVGVVRPLAPAQQGALHLRLRSMFPNSEFVLLEHHLAHAASAFYPSPFTDATVLTLDRGGDFRCGARWHGHGTNLHLERELYFPDSLGDVYGRVTELLGFRSSADEHKIQWLSADGDPRFTAVFEDILGLKNGDWPQIDRTYFDSEHLGFGGFSDKFYRALSLDQEGAVPVSLRADIAASLQKAVERAVLRMAGKSRSVCLAGGVALNALVVHALEQEAEVFVQPVSGNAGTAMGAVLHAWHNVAGREEHVELGDLCLGPGFTPEEIKQVLENCKLRFRYLQTAEELIDKAVALLNDQKIIAWMQNRMEFGPRALGNRSILASPLNPYSTENLNIYIKHREPFRKFAASVPAELAAHYFDVAANARHLATVGRVHAAHRKTFESALLGRDFVRVHTVSKEDNPLYHRLLLAIGAANGLPVLYNTSFNLFGDPLVCTPRDAVRSFFSSGIDALFAGSFVIEK